MGTWHTRLKQALEARGITPAELARATNNKPPSVSDWLSGKTKMMGGENAVLTCAYLKINHLWLFFDKGPSGLKEDVQPAELIEIDNLSEFVTIKRAEFTVSAGISGYAIEYLDGEKSPVFFRRDWLDKKGYDADKLVAISVSGDSMETSLYDGDLVVFNLADTARKDGKVYAFNYDGELVIKRLKRDLGNWHLSSDNQDKRRYPDKLCDERCFIIGRFVSRQSERI